MTRFAEVTHHEWIAAPADRVRNQFADLQHHVRHNVHPKLRFEVLQQGPRSARFVQEVKLLGLRQRDVFERHFEDGGVMVDTAVEGFNKGGSLRFVFDPEERERVAGTHVAITVKLPLPRLVGGLIRPLLEGQVRRELAAAAAEDKHDLEVRGYPAAPASRAG